MSESTDNSARDAGERGKMLHKIKRWWKTRQFKKQCAENPYIYAIAYTQTIIDGLVKRGYINGPSLLADKGHELVAGLGPQYKPTEAEFDVCLRELFGYVPRRIDRATLHNGLAADEMRVLWAIGKVKGANHGAD